MCNMEGGYSLQIFQSTLDEKYICHYCQLVVRDPIQTYCGHRYCRRCFVNILEQSHGKPVHCKGCQKEGVNDVFLNTDETHPDRAIIRDLRSCTVRCINDGCKWTGVFKLYQDHVNTCDHEMITCIHKKGCGTIMKRKDLTEHLTNHCPMRITKCTFCNVELNQAELQSHYEECDGMILECQYCRNVTLPRKEMKLHQDPENGGCSRRPIACKYRPLGCKSLLNTDGGNAHYEESVVDHQELLCNRVLQIKPAIDELKRNEDVIHVLDEQVKEHDRQVVELQETLKTLKENINKLQVENTKLQPDTSHIDSALKTQTKKIEETKQVCCKLDTKVSTYEGIIAVLNSQIERDEQTVKGLKRQRNKDSETIVALERKIKAQDRIIALKDVALAEQDLRIQSLEMASYDGVMIWKISDFNRKIQDARSGKTTSTYSPCFYTSRAGYKMCARIYLDGDGMGKGNHVSLFFVIMRGHNDALLRWPFRQKVTLMWLDQNNREHVIDAFRPDPTSSSFQRPKHDMNVASGCPLFMPIPQLDSSHHAYVKDNAAFIKIIVDTSDLG